MLFEQSGSGWLWWVCISRLESEGGRGGWAFCKKYSALFARGWLVKARPFPRHCVVWCLQKIMWGHTLTEQRRKENAKLADTFFERAGKTKQSSGHGGFSNRACPPWQPTADNWSFSVYEESRSAQTSQEEKLPHILFSRASIRPANLHVVFPINKQRHQQFVCTLAKRAAHCSKCWLFSGKASNLVELVLTNLFGLLPTTTSIFPKHFPPL